MLSVDNEASFASRSSSPLLAPSTSQGLLPVADEFVVAEFVFPVALGVVALLLTVVTALSDVLVVASLSYLFLWNFFLFLKPFLFEDVPEEEPEDDWECIPDKLDLVFVSNAVVWNFCGKCICPNERIAWHSSEITISL
jgi:hypothetical protein